MPDEPENHTIRLLQEMRAEMRQGFEGVNARIDDTNTRLDELTHILVMRPPTCTSTRSGSKAERTIETPALL